MKGYLCPSTHHLWVSRRSSDFSGANLSGASLAGSNLYNAKITQ
ncbi:pentapeptide repeat-containing protein [Legionella quinlivanii]